MLFPFIHRTTIFMLKSDKKNKAKINNKNASVRISSVYNGSAIAWKEQVIFEEIIMISAL